MIRRSLSLRGNPLKNTLYSLLKSFRLLSLNFCIWPRSIKRLAACNFWTYFCFLVLTMICRIFSYALCLKNAPSTCLYASSYVLRIWLFVRWQYKYFGLEWWFVIYREMPEGSDTAEVEWKMLASLAGCLFCCATKSRTKAGRRSTPVLMCLIFAHCSTISNWPFHSGPNCPSYTFFSTIWQSTSLSWSFYAPDDIKIIT